MYVEYTNKDYLKLAELLEKVDNNLDISPWCEFMKEWIKEFNPKHLVGLIIDCFFTAYNPSDIKKSDLKEIICNTPFTLLNLHTSEISLQNPKGIFATWRLAINK